MGRHFQMLLLSIVKLEALFLEFATLSSCVSARESEACAAIKPNLPCFGVRCDIGALMFQEGNSLS